MENTNWAGVVSKNTRHQIQPQAFDAALLAVKHHLKHLQKNKGMGTYTSGHEALGVLMEEIREYQAEVQAHNYGNQITELVDIAAGCIWAIASITSGGQDW